ncbi:Calcium-transporting ATPase 1, partial [Zancudomyces culisetae]
MEHENKTEVYGEEDGMDGMEDSVAVDIVEDAREKEQREFDAAFPDGRQSVEHQLDLYVGYMFAALRRRKEKKAGIKYGLRKRHVKKKEKKESLQQSIGTSETVEAHEGSSSDSSSSSSSEDEANEAESSKGKGESNVTMAEVMENLQYVLEFRIKNGHLGNLDEGLMDRLRDGLLMVMCTTSGSFPRRKLTKEARSAFYIFGGFIEEVAEFRQAVSEKRDMLLRESLCLGKRYDEGEEKMAITTMIRLVLGCLGPGYDWEDLVDSDYHSEMRKDIEECNKILDSDNHSLHIVKERKALYPPAALYTDKNMAKLKAMFKVDFQTGLVNDDDIKKREEHYGKNVLPVPKKKSVFRIIWDQLTDFMVILLFVAVVATAIAKEFDSSIVLACVIVLNTVIGAVEEIKAGRALAALENFNIPIARVLRKGKLEEIAAECVIPGDIVELQEGDSVPADLRLIECAQLEIVETILTGESEPVMKSPLEIKISKRRLALGDCVGNAFMGTLVAKGRGRGITVRTGARTEIGKISEAISGSGEERKTPLQQKLKWLGVWLVVIAIALCAIVVIAGVSWGHSFVPMFLSGLALAVSVIPEGLVAVTTVTMALAVRRMAKKNAIIRRLAAVEVLGSVTCICSDKTGTLTEGKMGVTEMIGSDETRYRCLKGTNIDPTCGGLVFEENCSNDDSCSNFETKFNEPAHNLLLASWLCNNAHIKFDESENVWKGIGDPTEVAILLLAYKSKLIPHEAGEKDGFE